MKKILLILILITLGAELLTGQESEAPEGGDGSEGSPYQIATLNNLYWIITNSDEWNKYYEQTEDIDASSSSGWDSGNGFSPIGNSTDHFTGSYDGQNHSISGLTINRSGVDCIGMFGYTYNATIENLGVTGVAISGDDYVGGLVGYHKNSSMTNCYSSGSVTAGNSYCGGLVGYSYEYASVSNCHSTCSIVQNSSSWYAGGLIGKHYAHCSVSNSYSTGSVNGGSCSGGFVGMIDLSSTVSNCYSTGSVTGNNYVGGLTGYYLSGAVTNCYSKGNVTGNSDVGGLVGYKHPSSIVTDSFWDTDSSGQSSSDGGTGKTTTEMKALATFTDVTTVGLTTAWDFETNPNDDVANNDYWDMDLSGTINNGYPFLSWENGDDVSLPVELASFSARQAGRSIVLEWITESEVENLGFIIERKRDQTVWHQIASYQTHPVLQGQGNTSSRTEYTFTDSDIELEKDYYYRLTEVSTSGDIKTYPPLYIHLEALPGETWMEKAYPNPFNPYTYISYHISEDTDVMITVYDMLGRSVKTLIDGHQVTGSYHVYWHGEDKNDIKTSTGQYIIRMQTDSMVQIQKVTFIK